MRLCMEVVSRNEWLFQLGRLDGGLHHGKAVRSPNEGRNGEIEKNGGIHKLAPGDWVAAGVGYVGNTSGGLHQGRPPPPVVHGPDDARRHEDERHEHEDGHPREALSKGNISGGWLVLQFLTSGAPRDIALWIVMGRDTFASLLNWAKETGDLEHLFSYFTIEIIF